MHQHDIRLEKDLIGVTIKAIETLSHENLR
jgi:hypothetical protein